MSGTQDLPSAPRYQQLATRLKAEMATGQLVPGQRLPSLRRQAALSGLGLNSVIRAYGELESAGFLVAVPRRGFQVAAAAAPPSSASRDHDAAPSRCTPLATPSLAIDDPAWQAMAHASDPALAPLGAAHPELDAPAVRRLYRLVRQKLKHHAESPSAYALPPGSPALREAIASHLSHHGHHCHGDTLLLCQGAQQGMSLILRQWRASRGRCRIGIEAPGYFGVLAAVEANGHEAIALPTHAGSGLDIEALARLLEEGEARQMDRRQTCAGKTRPEMPPTAGNRHGKAALHALIVSPDCHNPLGGQLSLTDRDRLLKLAQRHGVQIIENATFAELSFDTRLPWLMDLHQRQAPSPAQTTPLGQTISPEQAPGVITVGSLSKTLDPRARCGWVWLPRPESVTPDAELGMQGLIRARWADGMGDMPWMHAALAELIASGDYGRHVHRMRRCYAKRLQLLRETLASALGDGVWLPGVSGGYLQWCGLPGLDGAALSRLHRELLEAGIATLPGYLFKAVSPGLRLNAAQLQNDETLARLTTTLRNALHGADA